MCGIVGLFLKTPSLEPKLGQLTALMLQELCDRGPDSAGFAVYGAAEPGVTKLCAVAGNGGVDWKQIGKSLSQAVGATVTVHEIEDHAIFKTKGDGAAARRWLIDNVPGGNGAEPGTVDRDLQGCRRSRSHRPPPRSRRPSRLTRDRPHAHGHRIRRHHRRLASLLDRQRHLPRAQRLALEPQPVARAPDAPRRALPDRERQRSGRRLSHLAPAQGRQRSRTLWSARGGSRRLLYLRCRHARRLRGAARSRRLQAGRHGRDGQLGRVRHGVPRARRIAGRRRCPHLGAGARHRLRLEPAPEHAAQTRFRAKPAPARAPSRNTTLDLARLSVRQVNQLLHEARGGDFLLKNPRGAARHRRRSRRRLRRHHRRPRRLLLCRHEQARPRYHQRQCRHRASPRT